MTTNLDTANRFLKSASDEMERMKTYATVRAAVFTGMAFVAVLVDIKGALRDQAKATDRIASVLNDGKSWR